MSKCPECGGTLHQSHTDPADPYWYCAEEACDWTGYIRPMAHTPGPWTIVADGFYGDPTPLTILAHDATSAVAGIAGHSDPLDENMGATDQTWANARLIAAAPDLLDVARMLVESRDAPAPRFGLGDCVMRARAAIAKAEGCRAAVRSDAAKRGWLTRRQRESGNDQGNR